MPPFQHHLIVCDGTSCRDHGCSAVLQSLRQKIFDRNLQDTIKITKCICLNLCSQGPNLVVYPAGVWYTRLRLADIAEIVEKHLVQGEPVERCRYRW